MVKLFSKFWVVVPVFLFMCSNENPYSPRSAGIKNPAIAAAMPPFTPQGSIGVLKDHTGRVIVIARGTDNKTWSKGLDPVSGGGFTTTLWDGGMDCIDGPTTGNIALVEDLHPTQGPYVMAFSQGTNGMLQVAGYIPQYNLHNPQVLFSDWGRYAGGPSLMNVRVIGPLVGINGYRNSNYGAAFLFARSSPFYNLIEIDIYGNKPDHMQMLGGYEVIGNNLAVGRNQDGRLEVFASNGNGNLLHIWQTNAATNTWNPVWENLGGNLNELTPISVQTDAAGRLVVFVTFAPYWEMRYISQVAPNGTWGSWQTMTPAPSVAIVTTVAKNSDGRLELFYSLKNVNSTYHQWQVAPNSYWSTGTQLNYLYPVAGIPFSANIAVSNHTDGRLVVFVYGKLPSGVNAINYTYQDWNSPDAWSNWAPLLFY